MTIIIKRYQNRKLYNTQSKKYITLREILELIKARFEIQVIDNQSRNDITALTLSQAIFETGKLQQSFLAIRILTDLVLSGGQGFESILKYLLNSTIIFNYYDDEIERRVNLLIEKGELNIEEGSRILVKLKSVDPQQELKVHFNYRILEYLKSKQTPTKNDLDLIFRRLETLNHQLDQYQIINN